MIKSARRQTLEAGSKQITNYIMYIVAVITALIWNLVCDVILGSKIRSIDIYFV